jgi:hypothetical protein
MGTVEKIKLIGLDSLSQEVIFQTSWFPGKAEESHAVRLSKEEIAEFSKVIENKVFGNDVDHVVTLESLAESDGKTYCTLRISVSGKRTTMKIAISGTSYEALQRVVNSNIITDGDE